MDLGESPELPVLDDSVEQQLVVDELSACVRQVIDSLPEEYRLSSSTIWRA